MTSGSLPDVRHLPLADRRAVFLDGLRALTQMTGVVAKPGTFSSPAEYPGVMCLSDASRSPGDYAMSDDGRITWKAT